LKIRTIILSSIFAFFTAFSFAQSNRGSLQANILNSNNEPLPFATISLLNSADSSFIKNALSNESGVVYFNNITEGNYALSISYVGYEQKYSNNIIVKEGVTTKVGKIKLESFSKQLSEVVIKSQIGVTQISPGRIVYSASDLISQNGGTAGDILKNMPSVAMGGSPNHNRDIRLRGLGSGYTQVLINGKNSGISGNNRETVLDQIPASAIDYIEIITNPSAEYQGDGINGIVNIVLKKGNVDDAIKGSISFLSDNMDGYNGSLSLSQQKDKFEYYVGYDRLQRTIDNDKFSERTLFKNDLYDGMQTIHQREEKSFLNENLRVDGKYKLWKGAVISSGFIFGRQLEVKNKDIDINTTKADGSFKDRSFRTEPESKDNKFYEYSFDFRQTFKNNSVLKASISYLDFNQPKTKGIQTQKFKVNGTYDGNPTLLEETEMLNDDNYFANLDYALPIGKKNKIKMGYRLASLNRNLDNSLAKFNHTEGKWESSQSNQNNFIFSENTHALYVTNELNYKFIKLNAGIRAEQTYLSNESPLDGIKKTSSYLLVLPSISAQFNIDSTQYIIAGFGKRVRRPAFKDLSPFLDDRDPLRIKEGNLDLKPENSYNFELGYLKNFKKFNIGVNLFHRDIHDLIEKVISEDANNIQYTRPDNLSGAFLTGVEIMSSAQLAKWWTVNASYSYFESQISDPLFKGDAIKDQLKYAAKLLMDFNLKKQFNIQIAGNYLGPKPSQQASEKELYFVDFGISKTFFKNGQLMLRVSDVLDSVVKRKTISTPQSINNEIENTRGRVVSAGLKWNFY
jgi:outer membrane receptor for ferrienterochelin and colicin